MKTPTTSTIINNERGVSAILVAILMIVFLGFAALALDLSHLFVAKNELQNAADAGALAGARFLYNEDGTAVNPGANQIGHDAAVANRSEKDPVEVNWTSGNTGDVLRGHWSFSNRTFTPNASLEPVDLWNVSDDELDANSNFINAVQVTTRREATPIASFFARIFGIENFQETTTAVAYIGFAGTLEPGDVDAPIAICKQSVTGDTSSSECSGGIYNCNIGYMLSDGQDKNTAAWTNYTQPCKTASATSLRPLLTCSDSNPNPIDLGNSIGASNGVEDSIIGHPNKANLVDCWKHGEYWVTDNDGDGEKDDNEMASIDTDADGVPDMPWNLTLPVVNCPNLQVSNCMETCGAVNVNIVWILETAQVEGANAYSEAPYKMSDWSNDDPNGQARWDSFVEHFNLRTPNGDLATAANDGYKKKSIYFLPDCTPHKLEGTTGGHNFGVLARIPVLVK